MIVRPMLCLLVAAACRHAIAATEAMDYSMPAAPMAEHERQRQHEPALPPITLVKNGEFAVQVIRIINDSRNEEHRGNEIRETLAMILAKARETGCEVRFGQSVVTGDNYRDVPITGLAGKSDVSSVKIEIKKGINAAAGSAVVDDIEKALLAIRPAGRSELAREEFGIGILDPEKFRYELVDAIVKDVKTIQALMGADYTFSLSGLDKRIRWVRHSFNQLELYLDYSFAFSVKAAK